MMRYVFAETPTKDVCAFEVATPDPAPKTYPDRLSWCRRNGKHVATLNTGASQWWELTGKDWEMASGNAWTKMMEAEGFIKKPEQKRLFARKKKVVREP
jgi:hypothetical protein